MAVRYIIKTFEVYDTYILFKHSKLNEIQLIARFNE